MVNLRPLVLSPDVAFGRPPAARGASRGPSARPAFARRWSAAPRVMRRAGLLGLATILTVASGCDKPKNAAANASDSAQGAAAAQGAPRAATPDILFQVFGTREHPRMLPIAILEGGNVLPIRLDPAGWRRFDSTFLWRGVQYTAYQDGRARAVVRSTRGMWEAPDQPLYELAGCRTPIPLATVAFYPRQSGDFAVEMFASTKMLGWRRLDDVVPAGTPPTAPQQSDGTSAATRRRLLDSLDLQVLAVTTGATPAPTLIGARVDSIARRGDAPTGLTRHLFLIADRDAGGRYQPTYTHRAAGPLATAEFRRYVDHLDLTGDGVDEIILEGWLFRGETWLSMLSFQSGRWVEIFRSAPRWCADKDRGQGSVVKGSRLPGP
jgi:hypothetical protein